MRDFTGKQGDFLRSNRWYAHRYRVKFYSLKTRKKRQKQNPKRNHSEISSSDARSSRGNPAKTNKEGLYYNGEEESVYREMA